VSRWVYAGALAGYVGMVAILLWLFGAAL